MRILLDNTILVRASSTKRGLARDLLLLIVESQHVLLISNEMLYELANPRALQVVLNRTSILKH